MDQPSSDAPLAQASSLNAPESNANNDTRDDAIVDADNQSQQQSGGRTHSSSIRDEPVQAGGGSPMNVPSTGTAESITTIQTSGQTVGTDSLETQALPLEPDMPLPSAPQQRRDSVPPTNDPKLYKSWTPVRHVFVAFVAVLNAIPFLIYLLKRRWDSDKSGSDFIWYEALSYLAVNAFVCIVAASLLWFELRAVSELLFRLSLFVCLICMAVVVLLLVRTVRYGFMEKYHQGFVTWNTGPYRLQGCESRLDPRQSPLFFETTYKIFSSDYNIKYHQETFIQIQKNSTLCGQGFQGNSDLYGLGVRLAVYLQWVASILANNLLLEASHELKSASILFSLAVVVVTIFTTFTRRCTFSVEVEIYYWTFWGGLSCVFLSSPNSTRLGSVARWAKLDWSIAMNSVSSSIMIYHGAWYIYYAYDWSLARMPCGTYHFFLAPALDPSRAFWYTSDILKITLSPILSFCLLVLPLTAFLLLFEIRNSLRDSMLYQTLCIQLSTPHDLQLKATATTTSNNSSVAMRLYHRLKAAYYVLKSHYETLREIAGLPAKAMGGIRLITPIDIKKRRAYRIRYAVFGVASWIIPVAAIELTLRWNKVTGVHNLVSAGQYMALSIGLGTFITVCWRIVLQEARRRRNLHRRKILNQSADGIEMQDLPGTLTGAAQYAFAQPDVGFFSNDGALSGPSGALDGLDQIDNTVLSLDAPQTDDGEFMMSGAV